MTTHRINEEIEKRIVDAFERELAEKNWLLLIDEPWTFNEVLDFLLDRLAQKTLIIKNQDEYIKQLRGLKN